MLFFLRAGAFALGLALCVDISANTLTVNVADYNAAQLNHAGGTVAVPASFATYAATTANLVVGSAFTVTLPGNFRFASTPALTNNGTSTFSLASGGNGANFATYTVATADLTTGQSLFLGGFTVSGALALATPTPVASALPITMQSIGNDATPLSAAAFASEPGLNTVMVGAIQFIDASPPTLGRLYGTDPATDTATAVIAATASTPQLADTATGSVAVLGPDGLQNTLAPTDTVTVTFGGDWTGVASVFSSTSSDCKTPVSYGTVTPSQVTIPNNALNTEVFYCVTADGVTRLHYSLTGMAPVTTAPGSSTDFYTTPTNVEFPGLIVYFGTPFSPSIAMAFAATSVVANEPVALTFTLTNPNVPGGNEGFSSIDVSLSSIAFTDNLPAGLLIASPNALANTCGGTVSAAPGSNLISLTGGALSDGGVSCTITVLVAGSTVGTFVDTTSVVTSTEGHDGGSASATLNVTPIPTTTTLTLSRNPVVVNWPVTASVTVASGGALPGEAGGAPMASTARAGTARAGALEAAPIGTVSVSGGGQSCTATLVNGSGSCALTYTTTGTFAIVATYAGDTQDLASTANATLVVAAPVTPVPTPTLSGFALTLLGGVLVILGVRPRARRRARA